MTEYIKPPRPFKQLGNYDPNELDRFYRLIAEKLNLLLTGVYGEMYMTNASQSVVVGEANTAYEVAAGWTAGELQEVTFGGDHYLQVGRAGLYRIVWSMSVDTGFAQNELEGGLMNGSAVLSPDKGTSHTTVAILSSGSAISGSAIVTLAKDDQISIYLRNHTAANNITVEHASVTLSRIGEI